VALAHAAGLLLAASVALAGEQPVTEYRLPPEKLAQAEALYRTRTALSLASLVLGIAAPVAAQAPAPAANAGKSVSIAAATHVAFDFVIVAPRFGNLPTRLSRVAVGGSRRVASAIAQTQRDIRFLSEC